MLLFYFNALVQNQCLYQYTKFRYQKECPVVFHGTGTSIFLSGFSVAAHVVDEKRNQMYEGTYVLFCQEKSPHSTCSK